MEVGVRVALKVTGTKSELRSLQRARAWQRRVTECARNRG